MTSDLIFCASVGIVGALLAAKGKRPILKLQRACVLLRAVGFQAQSCWEGGKARLSRWPEHIARAEREL